MLLARGAGYKRAAAFEFPARFLRGGRAAIGRRRGRLVFIPQRGGKYSRVIAWRAFERRPGRREGRRVSTPVLAASDLVLSFGAASYRASWCEFRRE